MRTKGDANSRPDPWVARLDGPYTWKVSASAPFLGYGALVVRDPWIGLAILTLAIGAALAVALRQLWRGSAQPGANRHAATPR